MQLGECRDFATRWHHIAALEAGDYNAKATRISVGFMLPKPEDEHERNEQYDWNSFFEWSIADMMDDPELTDEQKQELLRQLELPDDEWKPIELPEGAEPVSLTIIKMRRGECYNLID